MRLPSIQRVFQTAATVAYRFPLTLLCALVLGAALMYDVRLGSIGFRQLPWLYPVLSTAGLGLSLTLALALVAERYGWRPAARWAGQAAAVALLLGWYALAPAQPGQTTLLRFGLLLLGLHLAVAAGPYLAELRGGADTPGFWRYNETLLLRLLTAGLYSGVLYVGCALALVAVDNLFDVQVNRHAYGYLFFALATWFNTWVFLAGVPRDFAALEQDRTYPRGLLLFTQFVLLPLVVLYLLILYAYLARIVLHWELPKGWVSLLVLALAVAGIFALLLIHPIREAAENAWIRTFARWFYWALFPLLALLAVAIGTRVRAYGITEERYFVLVLAAWLCGMAGYFLLRRGQGIIWIPVSLGVVALLAAGGPWGAFAVARRSQLARLQATAARYQLLTKGKLDGVGPRLSPQARRELWKSFDFFLDRQEPEPLQAYFTARLTLPDSLRLASFWDQEQWLRERLEQATASSGTDLDGEQVAARWDNFQPQDPQVWPLGRGRYWFNHLDLTRYEQPPEEQLLEAALPEGTFRLLASGTGRQLHLQQRNAAGRWEPRITLQPGALADSLAAAHPPEGEVEPSYELPAAQLILRGRRGKLRLQVFVGQLNRLQRDDEPVHLSYEAQALLEIAP
jgi:hypothetical protein